MTYCKYLFQITNTSHLLICCCFQTGREVLIPEDKTLLLIRSVVPSQYTSFGNPVFHLHRIERH